MPVEFCQRWGAREYDADHSKRRDRSRAGIKMPNDYRRGGRKKSRR